jgi:tetratricopeptide (TPR) repeat protein
MLRLTCEDGAALTLHVRYHRDCAGEVPQFALPEVGNKDIGKEDDGRGKGGRKHRRWGSRGYDPFKEKAAHVLSRVPVTKQAAQDVFRGVRDIWQSVAAAHQDGVPVHRTVQAWLPKYFPAHDDSSSGRSSREQDSNSPPALSSSQSSSGLTDFQMPTVPPQHFDDSSKLSRGSSITLEPSGRGLSYSDGVELVSDDVRWLGRRAHILKRNTIPKEQQHLPRCWYGDACRRSNPVHFDEYAHPITHPSIQISEEWHVVDGGRLSGSGDEASAAADFVRTFDEQQESLRRSRGFSKRSSDGKSLSGSSRGSSSNAARRGVISDNVDQDDMTQTSPRPTTTSSAASADVGLPSSFTPAQEQPADAISSRSEFFSAVQDAFGGSSGTLGGERTPGYLEKKKSSTDEPNGSGPYASDAGFAEDMAKSRDSLQQQAGEQSPGPTSSGGYASDESFVSDILASKQAAAPSKDFLAADAAYRAEAALASDDAVASKQTPAPPKDFLAADAAYREEAALRPAEQQREVTSPTLPATPSAPSLADQLRTLSLEELRDLLLRTAEADDQLFDQVSHQVRQLKSAAKVDISASSSTPLIGSGESDLSAPADLRWSQSGYWNGNFLEATSGIRKLGPNTRQGARVERYQSLANHGQDFIDVAKTYGAILISEVGLDDSLKTIPTLKGKGFAGGDKYFVHGIYFKLAVDTHACYGGRERSNDLLYLSSPDAPVENLMDGDERAMRVAGHELRHLITVFNCWNDKAHVAMCACLDFRGFRMLAMSALPITDRTLRYGCADAAKGDEMHVYTGEDDQGVSEIMKELSETLNLKSHEITASVGSDGSHPTLFTPVDVEGHRGADNKIYLIDLSRLFPPVDPALSREVSPDPRSDFLVYLFRPEFVATYSQRLNPDAFSPFCSNKTDREDIVEATKYLLEHVCRGFVGHLHTVGLVSGEMLRSYPLVQMLHIHGINLRYMGHVRSMFTEENMRDNDSTLEVRLHWRTAFIMEMVARTIKQLLRKRLRDETFALRKRGNVFSNPWKRVIIESFNCVFGALGTTAADDARSHAARITRMWDVIYAELLRRFPRALDSGEIEWIGIRRRSPGGTGGAALRDLLVKSSPMKVTVVGADPTDGELSYEDSSDARCVLFKALCEQLGLDFSTQSYELATRNPRLFDFQRPFEDTDLVDFVQRTKHLNIVAHSQGFLLRTKAMQKEADDEAQRLFQNAIDLFRSALHSDPSNKHSLRNLAECLACSGRAVEADFCFQAALNSDAEDTNTLFKYAIFLDFSNRLDDAEDMYLRALEAHPYHSNCLVGYADFLACARQAPEEAVPFYEAAIGCDPESPFARNNLACLLGSCAVGNDDAIQDRALQLLREAVECDSESPTLLRNFAIQLDASAARYGEKGRAEAEAAKAKYQGLVESLRSMHYVEDTSRQRDSFLS